MGRALIVRIGVGRRFKKPATKLSRMSSAWPTLVALDPSERPQLLLDALRKSLRHEDLALSVIPRMTCFVSRRFVGIGGRTSLHCS